MKKLWPVVLLVILIIMSVWLNLSANQPPALVAPPAMDASQIRAAKDFQVVSLVTNDLRWKLATARPADQRNWHQWPAPARHLMALSLVERDDGDSGAPLSGPPVFLGFADLLARSTPDVPSLAELSEAYTAIGAPAVAAVVDEAAALATGGGITPGEPVTNPERFDALDGKLRAKARASGVIKLMRKYVMDNADAIVEAKL